jgi:hypothetical protein
MGAYDPAEGMGKFKLKIKVPKVIKKIAKVVTVPVRAAVSSAISVVSPKIAHALTPEISKKDFQHIGKIGDVAAVAAGAVIAAPVIAAGASAIGGAVASGASSLYGAITGGGALTKTLAPKLLSSIMSGHKVPTYQEQPAEVQQQMTQTEYDALVAQQQATADAASITAAAIPQVLPTSPRIEASPITAAITSTPMTPMAPTGAIQPATGTEEQGTPESENPFLSYSEEQLAAEKQAVEAAISYRQSKGLSADGDYKDMTLVQLYAKKALIMAAYTPILMKKYGLYAAGGLGLLGAIYLLNKKK